MYIDPRPTGRYVDVAVATGLIEVARTGAEIERIAVTAKAEGWRFDPSRLAMAGIPSDAAQRIANAVSTPLQT